MCEKYIVAQHGYFSGASLRKGCWGSGPLPFGELYQTSYRGGEIACVCRNWARFST